MMRGWREDGRWPNNSNPVNVMVVSSLTWLVHLDSGFCFSYLENSMCGAEANDLEVLVNTNQNITIRSLLSLTKGRKWWLPKLSLTLLP